jgi:hypothetical protein
MKPQRVRCKLGKNIEQPCSDVLAYTRKSVRVLAHTTSIQLSEDNHDSWEMRTTIAECKTIITAVLTVMSGMDPHMIRGIWDWFGLAW